MSLTNEDERSENEEVIIEKDKAAPKSEEKKGGLSGMKSAFLLVLILIGLFYAKPYLTGEKEIAEIPSIALGGEEVALKQNTDLKIPTLSDKELRKLLQEFKAEYVKIVPQEEILATQPSVRAVKFSKDRTKLLLELEHIVPAIADEQVAKSVSTDLIFTEDEFGRLVTSGRFEGIKLYPEKK